MSDESGPGENGPGDPRPSDDAVSSGDAASQGAPAFPFEGVFPLPSPFGHERGIPTRPKADTGQTPRRRRLRQDRPRRDRGGRSDRQTDSRAAATSQTEDADGESERSSVPPELLEWLSAVTGPTSLARPTPSAGPFHLTEPSTAVDAPHHGLTDAPPIVPPDGGASATETALARIEGFFAARGWTAFPFQRDVWRAYLDGCSGLLHATTGSGKTLAVWLGPVAETLLEGWPESDSPASPAKEVTHPPGEIQPPRRDVTRDGLRCRVLWITPLRALAQDTWESLKAPLEALGLPWTLETRTGDTTSGVRSRQVRRLPTALVTTPESLSLLLTRDDVADELAELRLVIVDEWHELLATKRGVQVELALARLRRMRPGLRTWGLSATLGNLDEAMAALTGRRQDGTGPSRDSTEPTPRLITGRIDKTVAIDSLLPETIERFPWAGHLGTRLVEAVAEQIDGWRSALVFTNTRSQTEIWYRELLAIRPHWAGQIALHHGSLDQETRGFVERGLRQGDLRCVVCTSSLDLGVDFSPVDRVVQVGSPKAVARLLQRAGRSGHRPGAVSRITCVPAQAMELVEVAAARDAAAAGRIESRHPIGMPLDTLAQHLVTLAIGGGVVPDEVYHEVRQTAALAELSREDFDWTLDFVAHGGDALRAYPEYHRLRLDGDRYVPANPQVVRRHRLSIGTIVSDSAMTVEWVTGGRLGTIEESFLSRLKPGDTFTFAGRTLELVRIRDMKAQVRRASTTRASVPRWNGTTLPISGELSEAVRDKLEAARAGVFDSPEMRAVRPVLELQRRWSAIPARGETLIERTDTREGAHLFLFPFAGRAVHEGLATLLAYRLVRTEPATFTLSVNDYGLELLTRSSETLDAALSAMLSPRLFSTEGLREDLFAAVNSAEMAKRQFREIARVSGLIFDGYPGQRAASKQLQASTTLLYDVFQTHDPDNRLLEQARREVLSRHLEGERLAATMNEIAASTIVVRKTRHVTPLAFPLLIERLREQLTSEKLADRVRRMTLVLERAADA